MTSPTGWQTRHDPEWHGSDKWVASNLRTGETVFASDPAALAHEVAAVAFQDARWLATAGVR